MSRWIREVTHSHLILSYFNIICSESSYRQKWIPIELLCDHMHLRFNVEDDMKFTKTMLTRTIFKIHGKTGSEANKVVLAENLLVDMYWHGHCEKGSGRCEFEYGGSKEGYWNYAHMVCQFEDCVDVLKILQPTYHFVFLFDQSSGH